MLASHGPPIRIMLLAATVILILAAVGGAWLALRTLRGHRPPAAAGALHGMTALAGLVLLIAHDLRLPQDRPLNIAAVLLLLTATGGLLLLGFRLARQPPPGFVLGLHAGFAAVALAFLFAGWWRS